MNTHFVPRVYITFLPFVGLRPEPFSHQSLIIVHKPGAAYFLGAGADPQCIAYSLAQTFTEGQVGEKPEPGGPGNVRLNARMKIE